MEVRSGVPVSGRPLTSTITDSHKGNQQAEALTIQPGPPPLLPCPSLAFSGETSLFLNLTKVLNSNMQLVTLSTFFTTCRELLSPVVLPNTIGIFVLQFWFNEVVVSEKPVPIVLSATSHPPYGFSANLFPAPILLLHKGPCDQAFSLLCSSGGVTRNSLLCCKL